MGMQDMRVEKLIRIGKRVGNKRPLLVKLGSKEKKWALSNAKKLRNSEKFERVYLAKDMTEEERRKDKQLRDELRNKRQAVGAASFIIRRGKIIKMDRKEQKRSGELEPDKNENEGRNRVTDQRSNMTV